MFSLNDQNFNIKSNGVLDLLHTEYLHFNSTIVRSRQISKKRKVWKCPLNSLTPWTYSNYVYGFLETFALNGKN